MDALLVAVICPVTMLAAIALAKVALVGLFAMLRREPLDI
jgi:hypothetical protein